MHENVPPPCAGVLKSLVGLSASIYTSVYAATLKPDGLSFLLVIACAPLAAGLLAMPVFNAVPSDGRGDEGCKQEAAGAWLPSACGVRSMGYMCLLCTVPVSRLADVALCLVMQSYCRCTVCNWAML